MEIQLTHQTTTHGRLKKRGTRVQKARNKDLEKMTLGLENMALECRKHGTSITKKKHQDLENMALGFKTLNQDFKKLAHGLENMALGFRNHGTRLKKNRKIKDFKKMHKDLEN